MQRRTFLISGLQLSALAALGATQAGQIISYLQANSDDLSSADLQKLFMDPPKGARPLTLWHWMNGLISKEGITADLESFKAAGLAGVQVFLVGGSEMKIDDPANQIMNENWRELNRFAIRECARLGLEFGTHNSPGWSSTGYPTITPDQAMQKVIFEEMKIKGASQKHIDLPGPKSALGFYKDIAVYAVKTEAEVVTLNDIVDLTTNLSGNTLTWNVPHGNCTIFRFGHTAMESKNGTAPISGQGLEVDKLRPEPLREYWKTFPQKMIDDAGKEAGRSLIRFEIDSYEHGLQNWSETFREEFIKRRGYDPAPFLLTLAGKTTQSKEHTDRFKYDQRQTIRELFEKNYLSEMQRLIHQVPGMELILEPYSTGKEQPFETNNASEWGDLLMCEFWQKPTTWGWDSVKPTASGAHVWGKNLVAAEAFTGQPNSAWKVDPFALKSTGDRAFAGGVNKLFFHTSAHQPWKNVSPGMTMGQWGTHFGPQQTWWTKGGREWITYLSRCQFLLQAGLPVADICYLTYDRITPAVIPGYDCDTIGTNALLQRLTVKDKRLVLPNGVSYQALVLPKNTKMLPAVLNKIADLIEKGATVIGAKPSASPSLENYPNCDATVRSIADRVWGDKDSTHNAYGAGQVYQLPVPEVLKQIGLQPDLNLISHTGKQPLLWIHRALPSDRHIYFLSNQEDIAVSSTVTFRVENMIPELWDPYTGKIENAVFGNSGNNRTELQISLPPSGSMFVLFLKKSAKTEFVKWFNRPSAFDPTLWSIGSEKGQLYLMAAEEGQYKVETVNGRKADLKVNDLPPVQKLNNGWQVEFLHPRRPSENLEINQLVSWTELAGEFKYFSGTARYKKTLSIPSDALKSSRRCMLDLGEVKNTVEIKVNGTHVSTLWAPPFIQDITKFMRKGDNLLEFEVTNLWANRLIGDEQYPEDLEWNKKSLAKVPQWVIDGKGRPSTGRQTFATYKFFDKDSKLLPSGLIGPVSVRYVHYEKLKLS